MPLKKNFLKKHDFNNQIFVMLRKMQNHITWKLFHTKLAQQTQMPWNSSSWRPEPGAKLGLLRLSRLGRHPHRNCWGCICKKERGFQEEESSKLANGQSCPILLQNYISEIKTSNNPRSLAQLTLITQAAQHIQHSMALTKQSNFTQLFGANPHSLMFVFDTYLLHSLEGLLFPNAHMKSKTLLCFTGHECALHQGESLNKPLDRLPKGLLPAIVDRWDWVADHDVAEESNSNRNKAVVAKKHCRKKVGTQEPSSGLFLRKFKRLPKKIIFTFFLV